MIPKKKHGETTKKPIHKSFYLSRKLKKNNPNSNNNINKNRTVGPPQRNWSKDMDAVLKGVGHGVIIRLLWLRQHINQKESGVGQQENQVKEKIS